MTKHRTRTLAAACLLLATAGLAATGCSKSEGDDKAAAPSSSSDAAQQQVTESATAAADGCTLTAYGAQKLDLKNAVVGFSQSEKEDNPFRIAETQSIKDEAALKRLVDSEVVRDPSHVRALPLAEHLALFERAGLPEPRVTHDRLEGELESLVARSFPRPGDDATLRRIVAASLADDALGIQGRRDGDTIRYGYPVAVMAARRR